MTLRGKLIAVGAAGLLITAFFSQYRFLTVDVHAKGIPDDGVLEWCSLTSGEVRSLSLLMERAQVTRSEWRRIDEVSQHFRLNDGVHVRELHGATSVTLCCQRGSVFVWISDKGMGYYKICDVRVSGKITLSDEDCLREF